MSKHKPITPLDSSLKGMRFWIAVSGLAIFAGGLIGCAKPDSELSNVPEASSGGAVGTTNSGDSTEPDKAAAIKKYISNATPNTEELTIKDDPGLWKDAEPAPAPIKASIGSRIDDGLAALPATLAEIQMECVDRGSILRSTPKIKIQDGKHYAIEYTFPELKGSTCSISADGSKRILFEDGKIEDLPAFGKSETRVKMNRKQIEDFTRRMPADGFRYFSHGDRPWSALVAGLEDPKNNFKVEVSETEANPVGSKRPFYRVLARSTKGEKLDIEIVVDSKRNVPVVFRATSFYPDGETRQLVWKAKWSFGGSFEKGEFKLPESPVKRTVN